MADIWIARMIEPAPTPFPALGELLVIKTLQPQRAAERHSLDRFAWESELHKRLDHPNVVRCFGSGAAAGTSYIALEYIQGVTLRQMIDRTRPLRLPLGVALEVMVQVCVALGYLHDIQGDTGPLGLVHGDVSPENVMIGFDGSVKLLDFGLVTPALIRAESKPWRPAANAPPGTSKIHPTHGRLLHLAPERITGAQVDRRSDLYSVGVMLFELIHGIRPFASKPTAELLNDICHGWTVPGDPDVPPAIERVIARTMAATPDARLASGHELAAMLTSLFDLFATFDETVRDFVRRIAGVSRTGEAFESEPPSSEETPTRPIFLHEPSPDTLQPAQGTELYARFQTLVQRIGELPSNHTLPSAAAPAAPDPLIISAAPPQDPMDESAVPSPHAAPDLFATPPHRPPSIPDLFAAGPRRTPSELPLPRPPPRSLTPSPRRPGSVSASFALARPREHSGSNPAAVHFDRGWQLLREGNAAGALAEWEEALALDRDNRTYALNVEKLKKKLPH
jgi:serine/threonine-protein kinase